MRIPDETIEQIRSSADIVDVVSAHVRLKKRGKNFVGLCPFHTEKTPSFTVSPDKQMYHCFGCAKGGNVFTFIMETEKVSFVEAVRALGDRVGIPIVLEESGVPGEVDRLYEVCRFAGKCFHENLLQTEEGRFALEYFRGRGFDDETIRSFGLGYSMNSWESLLTRARQEGFSEEELLKAGLVRQREDGSHYDYFRGRAMFPIFSVAGRVIGFGARKLREDDVAGKYLNSPETLIYNKSRILYGLFNAKEAIRSEQKAIVVEGYADLLSLHQAGFINVVASSGTALTREQVQLVKRYARTITLVFDPDSAGASATLRGVDVALEEDLDVETVLLPDGKDPDLFVQTEGAQAFQYLLDHAVSFIDYKADQHLKSGSFTTPEGTTEAIRSIVQSIARIKDELKRNIYLKHVAEKYDLYESVLHREMEKWISPRKTPARAVPPASSSEEQRMEMQPAKLSAPIGTAERDLLAVLLTGDPATLEYVFANITMTDLEDSRVKELVQRVLERVESTGRFDFHLFLTELEDESLRNLASEVMLAKYELSKGWQELDARIQKAEPLTLARDAVFRLKKNIIDREIAANRKGLREAEQQGKETRSFTLRHVELLEILKELERIYRGEPIPKPGQTVEKHDEQQ